MVPGAAPAQEFPSKPIGFIAAAKERAATEVRGEAGETRLSCIFPLGSLSARAAGARATNHQSLITNHRPFFAFMLPAVRQGGYTRLGAKAYQVI